MKKTIFCKVGESQSSIHITTNDIDCPEGFLIMDENRPTNNHICVDNGDGTGRWEIDRSKLSKTFLFFLKRRNWLFCIIKIINMVKPLFKTISKFIRQYLYVLIFVKNLLHLNDMNKKITYTVGTLSLLLIICLAKGSTLQSIIISIFAASIFNVFIIIIPSEIKKNKKALKIAKFMGSISEIKNSEYINLKYLKDPMQIESMYDKFIDTSMDKKKALKLLDCILKNIHEQPECISGILKNEYRNNGYNTNLAYITIAEKYVDDLLHKIVDLDCIDLFPKFNFCLEEIIEKKKENKEFYKVYSLNDKHDIGQFITVHFKFIEYLEYWYIKECMPYINVRFGFYNAKLEFTNQFKSEASNIRVSTYW